MSVTRELVQVQRDLLWRCWSLEVIRTFSLAVKVCVCV